MYRLKKYQYLLYKHFLLHGLNISVAISGEAIAATPPFRLYWLSLNAAYVLEFFLQTLVRSWGHMVGRAEGGREGCQQRGGRCGRKVRENGREE